ncbi:MAG: BCD family MFS transporter [Chloroflexota bacterium]|nr:MAG: BCD family MFS transporter [Chloroflexota bacterium]UCF28088.1 MAG: BCD family MFS transporter [Chloroflexota bacterium]
MFLKRVQLGLIHLAVAMTLVPINSTLNRVMIKELAFSATLVAILASLPYLFSPIQVLIGSFSDRHPIFGWHRTPYIALGLVFCVLGVVFSPLAAFVLAESFWIGLLFGLLAFGAWGMGFNFATVSYFSLATDLSGEKERGSTISVMFFMMIIGIISTSLLISRLVTPYSPEALVRSFWIVGVTALILGFIGLIKLEKRTSADRADMEERYSWRVLANTILENKQATIFFVYLIILLIALLGQDILLEPFGGEAFGMAVQETTRITSIWGAFTLLALLAAGFLERRTSKRMIAFWGGGIALVGFVFIAASGVFINTAIFYTGVILLGIGTGLSTVSNLSLMLDMTTASKVGLFIGAWGMANAASRLIGALLSGVVRDVLTQVLQNPVLAYVSVFSILALLLFFSLLILRRIDVSVFRQEAESTSVMERAALVSDV